MKKVIRLTESDLIRLVKRIIREDDERGESKHKTFEDYAERFLDDPNRKHHKDKFVKNNTNINMDAIYNYDSRKYKNVGQFLTDLFGSGDGYFEAGKYLYFGDLGYTDIYKEIVADLSGVENNNMSRVVVDWADANREGNRDY